MKTSLLAAVFAALVCQAQTNDVSEVISTETPDLSFDAGADFRVRQEIMHNVPGLPGDAMSMMPRAYKEMQNHIRYRPRVWTRLDSDSFTLYGRLVDEMREYPVKNGVKRKNRNYNFPDEVILDNLYFEGRGLFDGLLDFKVGRQDLLDGPHSVFGLDRILQDGTPYDGSRSCYADMARVTFHTSDTSKLDAFVLYDNSRNDIRWGNHTSRGRPLTAINPRDSAEMDEWGGGLVWNDRLLDGGLPYQLYVVHKHAEAYTQYDGTRVPDKQITTVGAHLMPEIDENLSFEFDVAQQFGTRSNGAQAGGCMGYAAIDFHKAKTAQGIRPYTRLSAYYLSGDRHRTGAHDGDTAWDPMWARAPQDSELVQYGNLYGLGYWSNILYTKATLGADLGKRHAICAYTGPMWAAAQDHLGHADGSGESMFKGVLSAIRYDVPILLAPKNATGADRFEIFGHLLAELYNPGDYYDSSRPSYFIRWEFTVKF
ncbi:MAG: hypothetical protein ACI4RA_01675 [Kiritimatiellia bacterium]